jgi:phosphate transport system permease protein
MTGIAQRLIEKGFFFSALVNGAVILLIFGFMLVMGFPIFRNGQFMDLLAGNWAPARGAYGIYPMVVGTLAISLLSLFLAFPVSLGCAFFAGPIAPAWMSRPFRRVVQFMTGIPTVIYGFVGIFLLVPIVRGLHGGGSGRCILSAAMMLSVLVSPTMILFFCDSLDRVPKSFLDTADALGATPSQKLLLVMLPWAKKDILSGLILAFGRAVGDTMVALMIAGNAIEIPGSIFDSARTLTSHIALVIAADYESLEFKSIFACGLLLYLFDALLICCVRLLDALNNRRERA